MLINGWKAAWRYHVVIAGALLAVISGGYLSSATVKAALSPDHFALLTAAIGLLIPVLRVMKQPDATAAVVAQAAVDQLKKTEPAAPADPPKDAS